MLHILVANVGSTSLKYKLVSVRSPESEQAEYRTLATGSIERIGLPGTKAIAEHLRPDEQGRMQVFTSEEEEPLFHDQVGPPFT